MIDSAGKLIDRTLLELGGNHGDNRRIVVYDVALDAHFEIADVRARQINGQQVIEIETARKEWEPGLRR